MSGGAAPHPTIFALSSGAPPAAIAIVRISGPDAGMALRSLAGRVSRPRRATLVRLRDATGNVLDHAIALWFPGPDSATGEDLVELHLHGGRAVIAAVLAALAALPGLAAAEPGGFTRRAFANGRIDLDEAEGLADLLAAETEGQRRQAMRLAEGGLGRLIDAWRVRALAIAAAVEAAIDHDDAEEANSDDPSGDSAAALAQDINRHLAEPPAERLRDGLRIVIAGPVNAGKSSLLNSLAERDVAITSPIPGTTRDLVEAPILWGGVACILIDAAGLRDADDPIERLGVDRARGAIDAADILLWLGEPGDRPPRDNVIVVQARSDLPGREQCAPGADIAVSALTGRGLRDLRRLVVARAAALLPAEDRIALNARHRGLLGEARNALIAASQQDDAVLIAEQLRACLGAFDRISGRAGIEDMFDALFARFCIGK